MSDDKINALIEELTAGVTDEEMAALFEAPLRFIPDNRFEAVLLITGTPAMGRDALLQELELYLGNYAENRKLQRVADTGAKQRAHYRRVRDTAAKLLELLNDQPGAQSALAVAGIQLGNTADDANAAAHGAFASLRYLEATADQIAATGGPLATLEAAEGKQGKQVPLTYLIGSLARMWEQATGQDAVVKFDAVEDLYHGPFLEFFQTTTAHMFVIVGEDPPSPNVVRKRLAEFPRGQYAERIRQNGLCDTPEHGTIDPVTESKQVTTNDTNRTSRSDRRCD